MTETLVQKKLQRIFPLDGTSAKNNATGFGIEFRLLPVVILAIFFGFLACFKQWIQQQKHD